MIKLILKYSLIISILWTLIILILCCTPGKYIPNTTWLEVLNFDKLVHSSLFFVLIVLWLMYINYYKNLNKLRTILTLVLCVFYGGILEILQANVFSQRSGDWFDFIANTLGCLIGLCFFSRKMKSLI